MRNILIVLNERAGALLDRDPFAVKAELGGVWPGPTPRSTCCWRISGASRFVKQ